jgi:hypothetical protein
MKSRVSVLRNMNGMVFGAVMRTNMRSWMKEMGRQPTMQPGCGDPDCGEDNRKRRQICESR